MKRGDHQDTLSCPKSAHNRGVNTVFLLKIPHLYNYLTPFTELGKIASNFRQRLSHVYAINRNRMRLQLECKIFAAINWARLQHNEYFCAEFLEEIR